MVNNGRLYGWRPHQVHPNQRLLTQKYCSQAAKWCVKGTDERMVGTVTNEADNTRNKGAAITQFHPIAATWEWKYSDISSDYSKTLRDPALHIQ